MDGGKDVQIEPDLCENLQIFPSTYIVHYIFCLLLYVSVRILRVCFTLSAFRNPAVQCITFYGCENHSCTTLQLSVIIQNDDDK